MFDGKIQVTLQRAMNRGSNLAPQSMHFIQIDEVSVRGETQIVQGRKCVIDRDKFKPGRWNVEMQAGRTHQETTQQQPFANT
jgi:hypothetical protein